MDSGPLVQANSPTVREMQPVGGDFGRSIGPRVYPELISGICPRRVCSRLNEAQVDGSRVPVHYLFRCRHRQPQDDPGLRGQRQH